MRMRAHLNGDAGAYVGQFMEGGEMKLSVKLDFFCLVLSLNMLFLDMTYHSEVVIWRDNLALT